MSQNPSSSGVSRGWFTNSLTVNPDVHSPKFLIWSRCVFADTDFLPWHLVQKHNSVEDMLNTTFLVGYKSPSSGKNVSP